MPEVEIPLSEDLPHEPDAGVALWTESFCHWCFSPSNSVGLHAHFQRNPYRREIWQELFGLRLGDGTVLVNKSFGHGPSKTPDAAGLRIEVVEPFAKWRVDFSGPAQHVPLDSLRTSPLAAGPDVDVDFHLDVIAAAPPWRAGAGISWVHGHYEQAAVTEGHCTYGGVTLPISGIGYRDHSLGARDFSTFGDVCWLFGVFPSGRVFCAMESRRPGRDGATMAYMVEDGQVVDAEVMDPLPIKTPRDGQRFEFRLRTASGVHSVSVEYLDALPISMTPPSQQFHGCSGGTRDELVYYELSIRYELDGEVGYGSGNTTRRYAGGGEDR
jgi:hypothetical protein